VVDNGESGLEIKQGPFLSIMDYRRPLTEQGGKGKGIGIWVIDIRGRKCNISLSGSRIQPGTSSEELNIIHQSVVLMRAQSGRHLSPLSLRGPAEAISMVARGRLRNLGKTTTGSFSHRDCFIEAPRNDKTGGSQ
jgi:hypothetical protein